MKELGPSAEDLHADLAGLDALNEIDTLHLVGPLMSALYAKLPPNRRGVHVNTVAEMIEIYSDILKPGDCVLVKASLGTGLGAVVKAILQLGKRHCMSLEKEI
jgi:UDP-N-acetylmuramoyl-tripeptide--D-alanyl-D-alanine ligase